jgi:transketolase
LRQQALNTVYELAKSDPRVVFIGSDLGAGTLSKMAQEFPDRFFMEGISEQHIVGFASGLAKEGFIPFINTIGTFFTRRAFEQICIDAALHELPVRFLASGGGMVYAPLGPTHTSPDDLSLMLSVPNMQVYAPADEVEMENLIRFSVENPTPFFIRFGKGGERIVTDNFPIFSNSPKCFGDDHPEVLFITCGIILQDALDAHSILAELGITSSVIHCPYLNVSGVTNQAEKLASAKVIIIAEEHYSRGGLYSQILNEIQKSQFNKLNLLSASLGSAFMHNFGSQIDHLRESGLTGEKLATSAESALRSL